MPASAGTHASAHARPRAAAVELSATDVTELLAIVADRTGVDLAGQRPAMIARRAAHRIGASGTRTRAEYLDLLRADAAEPWLLLERLTIKVSRLFRNPETFALIGDRVLPELRRRCGDRELRVWSAGCAAGQEAYALAMLCAATGGPWSVLATDVDRAALARARAGAYPAAQVEDVPHALTARHLEPRGDGMVAIRPELWRHVQFQAHDLASGAPPARSGRFDLIACRNVLIYYLAHRQADILSLLVSALAPGGYLVLGEAEWPVPSFEHRLEVVDRAHRLFRAAPGPAQRSGS